MEHIGVCIVVENAQGKIILGRRKNGYKEGLFGTPGGRVELEERLIDACRRELFEETGIEKSDFEYIGVVREFQTDYNFIHFGFICKNVTDTPQNQEPGKCEGWEWYDTNSLPDEILPGHRAVIEMYMSGERLTDLI